MAKPVSAKPTPKTEKQKRSHGPRQPVVIERRPMNAAETADYIGMTERWVRRAVQERRIPFMRLGPRAVRFDPDQLDAWMEEQRVPAEER